MQGGYGLLFGGSMFAEMAEQILKFLKSGLLYV